MIGKKAANCFMYSNEQVGNTIIQKTKTNKKQKNRKQQVHDKVKNHQVEQDPPEFMGRPFSTKEFEEAPRTLKNKKSPGPTKLPVRCWNTSALKQSPHSWESSVTAGRQGMSFRAG